MGEISDDPNPRDLRSFGRKRGRKLSARQQSLIDALLPRVSVDLANPPEGAEGAPLWVEIGFGGAEHLIWQARRNPDVLIVGCEPFEEGVVKALSAIETDRLDNIRLHPDDARPLLRRLSDGSVSRAFILFPDPWPKVRHRKRRLVAPETIAELARVLRRGAELRFATDIADYARTGLESILGAGQFVWTATAPSDWRERPDDWPETRYEAKAEREGRRRYYFRFLRAA